MAEPLVAQYGPDVPQAIARMVSVVHPRFDADAFLHDALSGYEALALMPRGSRRLSSWSSTLPRPRQRTGPKGSTAASRWCSPSTLSTWA